LATRRGGETRFLKDLYTKVLPSSRSRKFICDPLEY
jgi:hypothetical protein